MNLRQSLTFLMLSLVWGSSYLWIKLAVRESGPFIIVSIRILLALLVVGVMLALRRPKIPWSPRWWGRYIFQGLFSTAIPWVLIAWAEKYIGSAEATVFNASVPFFTLILSHFFIAEERITFQKTIGILVGFIGVIFLVYNGLKIPRPGDIRPELIILAIAAILGSSLCYGISNVYARVKFRSISPIVQAFFTMLPADIIMWSLLPAAESPVIFPHRLLTWVALIWLGVIAAGISYVLFYRLLHEIGPTRVSLITYLVPLVGVILGVAVLKEHFQWSLAVGTVLVVSGIWGVNRQTRSSRTRP